jgi:hypothetical protein
MSQVSRLLISFEVKLPSACSFIVDGLKWNNKTTRKGKKTNTHTRIRKLTKTQEKNTNENVHSITTCKKGQQKQRSRFLQEYKSETSYTPEDGHVGRNI